MGLYDGWVTIARIAPDVGSSATTAPLVGPYWAWRSWSPESAACCAFGSIVKVTLPPLGWSFPTRSIIRLTNSRSSLPDSSEFSVFSIPVVP